MMSAGEPTRGRACAWCRAPFGAASKRIHGRIECGACGAATTDPWPTDEDLADAYSRYRPDSGRFSGFGDALLRRTRGALAKRVDALAPPGRVLDVGAGDGSLLDALGATGRESLGLEPRPNRPDVIDADISDLEGGWSAIVFWHALEHLRAPGQAVDDAAARLAPGGVLVVAVPNAASLQARAFGDRWLALDLPRHLVHLPASTLLDGLRARGFSVERVSHWRGGQVAFGWLHGLVGLLPGHPHLYDAIRRPEARSRPLSAGRRAFTLAAAAALTPVAALASALEVAARRGGSVYVEARHG